MRHTRRLAAILAADVAGYSRLIGADEEGTLNRLRLIRAEVIDPRIIEYRGRIVKTTGDGVLAVFSSFMIHRVRNMAARYRQNLTPMRPNHPDRIRRCSLGQYRCVESVQEIPILPSSCNLLTWDAS